MNVDVSCLVYQMKNRLRSWDLIRKKYVYLIMKKCSKRWSGLR